MAQSVRPFPGGESYSPALRQYLNRLTTAESSSTDQSAIVLVRLDAVEAVARGLTAQVTGLDQDTAGLQTDVAEAQADILQLQHDSATHDSAIALLNSRYDTARTDLDGVIATAAGLTTAVTQVTATLATHTTQLGSLQAAVDDLQQQDSLTAAAISGIEGRLTTTEVDLGTADHSIVVLQAIATAQATQINNLNSRLDLTLESMTDRHDIRLALDDAVLGTVPKVVGALQLPVGSYPAPQAYLGCPLTPTASAQLTLVTPAGGGTVIATLSVTGAMAWGTADTGLELGAVTAIELHLVSDDAAAQAVIKGLILQS